MFGRNVFIVMEHEEALLFREGRFVGKLPPGKHVYWGRHYTTQNFDTRWIPLSLPNQEVTCADGVSLKLSAKLDYRFVDTEKAYRSSLSVQMHIYSLLHEAVRALVGTLTLEEAMSQRGEFSERLQQFIEPRATELGIEVRECGVRDLAVSGEIKRAYGKLIVAQKEAQAALERARGENAALRSLANAARMIDGNPNLLQLRWIHALDQTKSATIVLSPSGAASGNFVSSPDDES